MDAEIVLAVFIGGIFQLVGLWMWQSGTWKKLRIEQQYKIKRFKLGNKYKLKQSEMPEKQSAGWMDILKKLDKEQISNLVDLIPDDERELGDNVLDGIMSFAQNNPEIVQNFLSGLGGGTQQKKLKDGKEY